MSINQIPFPITSRDIARKTKSNKILSVVYDCILKGIELPKGPEFDKFRKVQGQLNIDQGCILKGNRVVIPPEYEKDVLTSLHESHLGINRTKALARFYVWYPGIDKDIEDLVNNCFQCQQLRNDVPKHDSHSWEYPNKPWDRIHIDFMGPFNGCVFLVVVDAYSKWPEVFKMNSTTTNDTITRLKQLFARYGLPNKLVSDNGPQFISYEFEDFMKSNGILHIKSAPYHPQTNGEAERFVQTFKHYLKKVEFQKLSSKELDEGILRFLATYRCVPHSITEMSPSLLMYGRQIKGHLDLLRPTNKVDSKNIAKSNDCKVTSNYEVGEIVYFRNYTDKIRWHKGEISEQIGNLNFRISYENKMIKRHISQIRKCNSNENEVIENDHELPDEILTYKFSPLKGTEKEMPKDVANQNNKIPRTSARQNKGVRPRRYGFSYPYT